MRTQECVLPRADPVLFGDNMEIFNYFDSENKQHWLSEIQKADWGAAKFLAELLQKGIFMETLCEPENGGRLFLLTDGERLISFLSITRQDCIRDMEKIPWIGFVYTSPEYRGRGFCRSLMEYAEGQAKLQDYREVFVATDHIGLYERMGYEYIGNTADVWGEDSRIYKKAL